MAKRLWTLWGLVGGLVVLAVGLALVLKPHKSVTRVVAPLTNKKVHTRLQPGMHPKPVARSMPTDAPMMLPVSGRVIGNFGWQYSGALNEWYYNPGISISAPSGQTVKAGWGGMVSSVSNDPRMGLTVTVNDGNGFRTVYGHLGKTVVRAEQTIKQGQPVGTVGGPDLYSRQAGAHVDFQVYHGSTASDPMRYLHPSS